MIPSLHREEISLLCLSARQMLCRSCATWAETGGNTGAATASAATPLFVPGYRCDCTRLNERLYARMGSRHTVYAGLNCTLKLNACERLSGLCQHGSSCESTLSSVFSEQVNDFFNGFLFYRTT